MLKAKFFCNKCGSSDEQLIEEGQAVTIHCKKCSSKIVEITPLRGLVYIVSNPSMSGLVKVGFTTRDIKDRLTELNSSTSIPEPFTVEATFHSFNPQKDERKVHERLNEWRTNNNREFFKMEPLLAVQLVTEILKQSPHLSNEQKNSVSVFQQRKKFEEQGVFTEDPGPNWLSMDLNVTFAKTPTFHLTLNPRVPFAPTVLKIMSH